MAAGVRCKSCKATIPRGDRICPDCGKPRVSMDDVPIFREKPFIAPCEQCGAAKGRLIEEKENGKVIKSFYRCYSCWNSLAHNEERGFFIGAKNRAFGTPDETKYWTPAESLYQRNLEKYYLRPLFYKEPISISGR